MISPFEIYRRYKTKIAIIGGILVAFSFGITGVVIQVISPGGDEENPKDELAKLKVVSVEGTKKNVPVTRGQWDRFRRRWKNFYIERSRAWRAGFFMMEQGMMRASGAMMSIIDPEMNQRRSGQDKKKTSVLPESLQAKLKKRRKEIEGDSTKDQLDTNKKNWEKFWRILLLYETAQAHGFRSTTEEITQVVSSYLKRGNKNFSYKSFVEDRVRMNLQAFERAFKEYLTIIKFLSSRAQASYLPANINWVTNYRGGSENRYGKIMYADFPLKEYAQNLFRRNRGALWRANRLNRNFPRPGEVDQLSEFLSVKTKEKEENGENRATFERRQIEYLFIPLDPIRQSIESETKSGQQNESQQEQGDGENTVQSRALERADRYMKKILDRIAVFETRGKKIDFRELVKQFQGQFPVKYRTSSPLKPDDLQYWLKEIKGLRSSHFRLIRNSIFQNSLSSGKKGTIPNSPLWGDDGVFLPRLIEVREVTLTPSDRRMEVNGQGQRYSFESYRNGYLPWSMELKQFLRKKVLWRRARQQGMKRQWSKFVKTYRSTRRKLEEQSDNLHVPTPPEHYSMKKDAETSFSLSKKGYGPIGAFRNFWREQSLVLKRSRNYRPAVDAFRRAAERTDREVKETELFHLGKEGSPEEVKQGLSEKLSIANPRRIAFSREEDHHQVGIYHVLLPPEVNGLEEYIDDRRGSRLQTTRADNLRTYVQEILKSSEIEFVKDVLIDVRGRIQF